MGSVGAFQPLTDLSDNDVYYSPFPFYHGSGQIALIFMADIGGRVVIKDGLVSLNFGLRLRSGCTVTLFVPTMISWLLEQPEAVPTKRIVSKATDCSS